MAFLSLALMLPFESFLGGSMLPAHQAPARSAVQMKVFDWKVRDMPPPEPEWIGFCLRFQLASVIGCGLGCTSACPWMYVALHMYKVASRWPLHAPRLYVRCACAPV